MAVSAIGGVAFSFIVAGSAAALPMGDSQGDPPPDVVSFAARRSVAEQIQLMTSDAQTVAGGQHRSPLEGRGTTVGAVRTVFIFTELARHGDLGQGASPIEPNGTWIAPVLADSDPAATVLLWRPDGRRLEVAQVSEDRALAQALTTLPEDVDLVYDPPMEAWFSFDGTTLAPIGARAGAPVALDVYAKEMGLAQAAAEAVEYDPAEPLVGGADYFTSATRIAPPGVNRMALLVGILLVAAGVSVGFAGRHREKAISAK
jgi:hypothetical protein